MTREIEAVIWCPACKVDKYTVYRKEVNPGVFVHEREPELDNYKTCDCEKKVTLTRHE